MLKTKKTYKNTHNGYVDLFIIVTLTNSEIPTNFTDYTPP